MKKIINTSALVLFSLLFYFGIYILMNYNFYSRALSYPINNSITDTAYFQPKERLSTYRNFEFAIHSEKFINSLEDKLDSLIRWAKERKSSSLIILYKGKILLEKYFNGASRETKTNSMSMVKTVTALLVGKAIEEGFIKSIEEPAAKYIIEWQNDKRKEIKIKDLLYMQSGLRNDREMNSPFSDLVRLFFSDNINGVALNIPLEKPPGLEWSYNNINSQILGLIIERATGKRFANYLSEKIWIPINASDAFLWLDDKNGAAHTFAGLFASAYDWCKIGELIRTKGCWNGNQIIDSSWVNLMLSPSPTRNRYGMQIWLKEPGSFGKEPYLAEDVAFLSGQYFQYVYIVPSYQLTIVRTGERPEKDEMWDNSFLVNEVIRIFDSLPQN